MKKFIAALAVLVLTVSCWNSVKGTMVDVYSQAITPGVSHFAGCEVPNTVVQPYLASEFDRVLKVDRSLKKEAKRLEEMESKAKSAGLHSDEQKGLVSMLCKTAVMHLAPSLADRGKKFPEELRAIGCSKEKIYRKVGDAICSFAPAYLER